MGDLCIQGAKLWAEEFWLTMIMIITFFKVGEI